MPGKEKITFNENMYLDGCIPTGRYVYTNSIVKARKGQARLYFIGLASHWTKKCSHHFIVQSKILYRGNFEVNLILLNPIIRQC